MDYISIVFGILFCIEGFLLAIGKIHLFSKAWKSTPVEEKEKIDIKGLCRNVGEVIILAGLIFLINGLWPTFREKAFTIAIIAWVVVCLIDLAFIYKGHRYQKK